MVEITNKLFLRDTYQKFADIITNGHILVLSLFFAQKITTNK